MRYRVPVLLLLLVAIALPCRAMTLVQLKAESPIAVRSGNITLGDIASVSADDAGSAETLRAVRITVAPVPGQTRTIDAELIRVAVRCAGWEPNDIGLRNAHDVLVETASNRVRGQDLLEMVRNLTYERLSFPPDRITIEHNNLPPDFAVPSGELRITPEPPAHEDFIGLTFVPFSVSVDNRIVRRVSLNVTIRVQAQIAVASRSIARGEIIAATDFRLVDRDLSTEPAGACTRAETVIGKVAKVSIAADQSICDRMVSEPPLVHAQEQVTVQVVCNNVVLRLPGTSLQDGRLGEEVRVAVSLSTHNAITATVVDRGCVLLTIPGGAAR
jgi:flagellar basal body P-ring formation protein FlgA